MQCGWGFVVACEESANHSEMDLLKKLIPGKSATTTIPSTPNGRRFSDVSSTRQNMGWEYIDDGKTFRSFEHQSHRESPRRSPQVNSPVRSPKQLFASPAIRGIFPWRWWYWILLPAIVVCFMSGRFSYEYANLWKSASEPQNSSVTEVKRNEEIGNITSVIREELDAIHGEQLAKISEMITKFSEEYESKLRSIEGFVGSSVHENHLTFFDSLKTLMENEYQKMRVDPVGMPDYALAYNGAQIAGHSTTHLQGVRIRGPLKFKWFYEPREPEIVITKSSEAVMPGNCWAFVGNDGFVTIELSQAIVLSAISYEHASSRLIPPDELLSAPKIVELWAGLDPEASHLIGQFNYDNSADGPSIYNLPEPMPAKFVKFNVLDNHGQPEYTCLYRIRVYGKPI